MLLLFNILNIAWLHPHLILCSDSSLKTAYFGTVSESWNSSHEKYIKSYWFFEWKRYFHQENLYKIFSCI